jgi:hypothetical protein
MSFLKYLKKKEKKKLPATPIRAMEIESVRIKGKLKGMNQDIELNLNGKQFEEWRNMQ